VQDYPNIQAWIDRIAARPAVQRGLQVNPFSGVAKPWLVDEAKK
jgi:glutathione S-transferase